MLSLFFALACSGSQPAFEVKPDVVIISVNGLRADPLGEKYAEAALIGGLGFPISMRFRAAYAQSVQAYVSLASLLTGRYPSAIPVCGQAGPPHSRSRLWCTRLPDDRPSLPEVLALYGYRTALATARFEDGVDLAEEFQVAINVSAGHGFLVPWKSFRRDIGAWWGAEEGPRFLMVAVAELEREDIERKAGIDPQQVLQGPNDEQRERIQEAYAERAYRVGLEIAALLEALPKDRPRWVAITSAHGLSLAEVSGSVIPSHAHSPTHNLILDRTARVPLLLIGPSSRRRPEEVDHPVELLDLVPTIVALTGAVLPADLAGEDLRGPSPADPVGYSEYGDMLALRSGDHLLTFRSWNHGGNSMDPQVTEALLASMAVQDDEQPQQPEGHGGAIAPTDPEDHLGSPAAGNPSARRHWGVAGLPPQGIVITSDNNPHPMGDAARRPFTLYDVVADPMQTRDLSSEEVETVRRLQALLLEIRGGPGAPPEELLSRERVQELRHSGESTYW